jgi:endo-1,4-beta-xylanase
MKTRFFKKSLLIAFGLVLFNSDAMAQVPTGKSLLSDGLKSLKVFGTDSPNTLVQEVAVTGQPFTQALRIDTYTKDSGRGNYGLTANINTSLRRGDVLWVSFKARSLASKRETGESSFEIRFDQLVDGKYKWPTHIERGVSFGTEWTEVSFPFVMEKDVEPKDVRLIITFDSYAQRYELSPVTFINCGPTVKMSDLPRSIARYDGWEANAPWRKGAAERIEKHRKGDLTVKVVNAKGKPVKNAKVSIKMTRNAFNWGTATTSDRILDSLKPENKKYRDTLVKYFNQVVFENEMKWGTWLNQKPEVRGDRTKIAVKWLRDRNIGTRGHVMVWPSWEHTPKFISALSNNPSKLRDTIVHHISEQTSIMRGQFDEWDIINEPYAHNDVMKVLGKESMVSWFKQAHKEAPGVKLFLNDYTMFIGAGEGSASQAFYDNVKFLKDSGAPIEAIGEQGHIGGTPPAITFVLERLDHFSKLGLPIQISEFDINSNDDDLKARYTRDFITALYSQPAVIGFVQWGFWEDQHWFPVAAMWNKDWSTRENGKAYTELVTKTFWTNFNGKTASNGISKTRGFTGEYEITVSYKGKTAKQKYSLDNKGGEITLKL